MPKVQEKAKRPRIIALDLLRGYFLVSIILNHLQWYPNALDWVAFQGSMLVSAAEGFFIISGILLGIVRGRNMIDKPLRDSSILVLKRGVTLYLTAVILMLLFTVIGWFFMDNVGLKPGIHPPDQPFIEIVIGAFSLEYIYGWADFLRLYAVFLIATPLALWLLRKNKWYIVALVSIGIWGLFPFVFAHSDQSAEILMLLSWQLIFFTGLIIGFHWTDLQAWWQRQTKYLRKAISIPVLTIAAITLIINAVLVIIVTNNPESDITTWYNQLFAGTFNKEALPIERLLLFGLWFTFGLSVFIRYEKFIMKWFGWLLLPFGTNSLYVYILHAVVLFFAHLIVPPDASTNIILNFLGSTLVIGIIFLAVKKRFLFKIIPR